MEVAKKFAASFFGRVTKFTYLCNRKYCNMGLFGFFSKDKKETLDKGLEKTKTSVFDKLTRAVAGKSKVDDDVLDNLEEVLITSDVGVDTTLKIIQRIEERVARDKYVSTSELNRILREEIAELLAENNSDDNDNWDLPADHKPYVILVVGPGSLSRQARRYIWAPPTHSVQQPLSSCAYGVSE